MLRLVRILILGTLAATFVGCSSAELKARQEQRDRIVHTAKIYCEFIDGEDFSDIDVALNIAMGAKCDTEKSMSLINYRSPSESAGILFCCGTREAKSERSESRYEISPAPKKEELKIPAALTPTTVKPKAAEPVAPAPTPTPAPTSVTTQVTTQVVTPAPAAPAVIAAPTPAPKPKAAPITFEGSDTE